MKYIGMTPETTKCKATLMKHLLQWNLGALENSVDCLWTDRSDRSDQSGPEQCSQELEVRKRSIEHYLKYILTHGTGLGTLKVTVSISSTISIIEYYLCVL